MTVGEREHGEAEQSCQAVRPDGGRAERVGRLGELEREGDPARLTAKHHRPLAITARRILGWRQMLLAFAALALPTRAAVRAD
ncbi:hypothetical protein FE633_09200 [Streptomyces montanus]|uniref:Uncharacterized protein n=1 Tax=Streptomyces montanus TaxID=2580423 RepID=A0A5R9FV07_9ACTN|nr:hypothetical protein [Streptomyces montanus]TLS46479.1 hypothetical protein FE633_09200 [Streptomyces montanus]